MAGVILGLDCKLYRNTGNYASPTWNVVEDVRDVTLNLEKATADVTTRNNSGWRAQQGTLKEATLEFELIVNSDRTESATDWSAFQTSYVNNTGIELLVMDGAYNTANTQGLRATWSTIKFTRTEALEDSTKYSVSCTPMLSANAPSWYVGS